MSLLHYLNRDTDSRCVLDATELNTAEVDGPAIGPSVAGSKRTFQYNLRSSSPAKRARLCDADGAPIERRRYEEKVLSTLTTRRLELAWQARYKVCNNCLGEAGNGGLNC